MHPQSFMSQLKPAINHEMRQSLFKEALDILDKRHPNDLLKINSKQARLGVKLRNRFKTIIREVYEPLIGNWMMLVFKKKSINYFVVPAYYESNDKGKIFYSCCYIEINVQVEGFPEPGPYHIMFTTHALERWQERAQRTNYLIELIGCMTPDEKCIKMQVINSQIYLLLFDKNEEEKLIGAMPLKKSELNGYKKLVGITFLLPHMIEIKNPEKFMVKFIQIQ